MVYCINFISILVIHIENNFLSITVSIILLKDQSQAIFLDLIFSDDLIVKLLNMHTFFLLIMQYLI